MKKFLFSGLPLVVFSVLGLSGVSRAATFLSAPDGTASATSPYAFGLRFTVPVGKAIEISDIQFFDKVSGGTMKLGLWDVAGPQQAQPAGSQPGALFQTTVTSTGSGIYKSVGAISPIFVGEGTYTLTVAGFNSLGALGDTTLGNSGPTYSLPARTDFSRAEDFVAFTADPTVFNPAFVPYAVDFQRWKSVNFTYTVVPEPETYAMVAGAALVGFGLWRRRQSK